MDRTVDHEALFNFCRRSNIRCISSTATATIITAPLMVSCQKTETPIRTNPSTKKPITKAPISVPRTVPRPPESAVPPITTAALALSSENSPIFGRAAFKSAVIKTPTLQAQNPESA